MWPRVWWAESCWTLPTSCDSSDDVAEKTTSYDCEHCYDGITANCGSLGNLDGEPLPWFGFFYDSDWGTVSAIRFRYYRVGSGTLYIGIDHPGGPTDVYAEHNPPQNQWITVNFDSIEDVEKIRFHWNSSVGWATAYICLLQVCAFPPSWEWILATSCDSSDDVGSESTSYDCENCYNEISGSCGSLGNLDGKPFPWFGFFYNSDWGRVSALKFWCYRVGLGTLYIGIDHPGGPTDVYGVLNPPEMEWITVEFDPIDDVEKIRFHWNSRTGWATLYLCLFEVLVSAA